MPPLTAYPRTAEGYADWRFDREWHDQGHVPREPVKEAEPVEKDEPNE